MNSQQPEGQRGEWWSRSLLMTADSSGHLAGNRQRPSAPHRALPRALRSAAVLLLVVAQPALAAPPSQGVLMVPTDDRARAVVDGFVDQLGAAGVTVKTAGSRAPAMACLTEKDSTRQRTCLLEAAAAAGTVKGVLVVRARDRKKVLEATFEVLELASRSSVFKDSLQAPEASFPKASAGLVKKLISALGQLKRFEAPSAPGAAPATEPASDAPKAMAAPPSPAPRKIGVARVAAGQGVAPQLAAALEQGFEDELRKRKGVAVITVAQVGETLGVERQRQLLTDGTVAPDRLQALDADEVLLVHLTAEGADIEFNASRIDGHSGAVLGTKKLRVPKDDEAQVLTAPSPLVAALFPELLRVGVGSAAAADHRPIRVAILDVRAVGEVPLRALAALNQSVTPELRKLQGVSAINSSEVRDMLSLERQKELLGCAEDASACFAEMAGALDADELITLDLTLVGSTYALTSRRIDMRTSKVVQTRLERFERRDGEELLAIVGTLMQALYPERPLKPGRTRGVEASVVRRLNPPPLPRWSFFATAGVAVAASAAGASFGLLMLDTEKQYRGAVSTSSTSPVRGADLMVLEARAHSQASTANAFFITAAALALSAAVEAFFVDWKDDRAAFTAGLAAWSNGAGLSFALGF